jgi:glycosyltransferase involved in cell wall biosynthesis
MPASEPDQCDALDSVRILEIGHQRMCQRALPRQTTLISTHVLERGSKDVPRLTLRGLVRLWRALRAREHDVIVVYVEQWAPWHWKSLRRVVSLHPLSQLCKLFAIQTLRLVKPRAPLAVVDLTEWGFIHRHNEFLLDSCSIYFKRELPVDRWRVFRRSSPGGFPATRFRSNARNRGRVTKLHPLSLGCNDDQTFDGAFPEKTCDLFVAVTGAASSTVRVEGLAEIAALRRLGVKIDMPAARLPPHEFLARMSKAWLTWSPHGFGWDCFRHYEAPLAFSVPVISAPTIVRQFPLLDGEHCFYYFADDPDGLARAVTRALADRQRLRQMAEAARALVKAHHVWPGRVAELLRMTLGREAAPGGLALDKPA